MQVWKERHECYQCKRPMIIGITSNGTSHQSIHAIVCEQCATEEDLAVPSAAEAAREMWGDPDEALEKYMKWTPDDFKRNEELFIRHNFPQNTEVETTDTEDKEQAQP